MKGHTLTLVILVTLLLYFFLEVFYLLSEHHDCEIFAAIVLLLTTEARLVLPGVQLIASLLKTNHVCVGVGGRWRYGRGEAG